MGIGFPTATASLFIEKPALTATPIRLVAPINMLMAQKLWAVSWTRRKVCRTALFNMDMNLMRRLLFWPKRR